ncbi:hypothetical protein Sjap_026023 [Stephania japonica]|uniref:Uncharacterized protein n=1 Tax=Stephania japonica TaxID=461633 RepID=A0AAP0E690_9MAGN
MEEKWRRVDDEEDDDEVHLNIQEGGWWSRDSIAACSGDGVQVITVGDGMWSPTIIGREEEGGRGVVSTTSPPPLLPPPASCWDSSSAVRVGGRWGRARRRGESSPPQLKRGGARASPSPSHVVNWSTEPVDPGHQDESGDVPQVAYEPENQVVAFWVIDFVEDQRVPIVGLENHRRLEQIRVAVKRTGVPKNLEKLDYRIGAANNSLGAALGRAKGTGKGKGKGKVRGGRGSRLEGEKRVEKKWEMGGEEEIGRNGE